MTNSAEAVVVLSEQARLLGRTTLFNRMRSHDLGRLAARSKERPMRAGDTLFRRGDVGTSMLVILAGQVRIVLPSRAGREQVLRVLQAGEVLGELALLDGRARAADAVAETNGRLLMIERHDLMEALRNDPELAVVILGVLCERLRATNLLLESMLFHDAAARLASTLLMLTQGRPGRQLNITQEALGERVGAARETVNKKLREWQAEGIIKLEPGRVTVLDASGVRRHAPAMELADDQLTQLWS